MVNQEKAPLGGKGVLSITKRPLDSGRSSLRGVSKERDLRDK